MGLHISKRMRQSSEAYHALDQTFSLQSGDLEELAELASGNVRERALCQFVHHYNHER